MYRVVRQKCADQPLDIIGSWLTGGRWNPPGVGILYTAEHPALFRLGSPADLVVAQVAIKREG